MSTSYNNTPYSIPMYYEYNNDSESEIIIEMISKSDGNKIKILKENDVVTICIVKKLLKKTFSVICRGNVFLDDTLEMMKIRINVKSVSGRIYNS